MKKIILFISVFLLLFASPLWAETYWIDDNGEAANLAACSGVTPLSGASACSYDKAASAVAGDTVYYRAGAYSAANAIVPSNSGSTGSVILFSAYNSESVVFTSTSAENTYGVRLNGKDYIKVYNITFKNYTFPLLIHAGADHNEISYCTFDGTPAYYNEFEGSRIRGSNSNLNWIHHSTFSTYGYYDPNDEYAIIGVGVEGASDGVPQYNVIENCNIYHGSHHTIGLHGYGTVLRNNYIRNDAWGSYEGSTWGNRVLYTTSVWTDNAGRDLIEGNRIAYGDECPDREAGGGGAAIQSSYNIIRHNIFYQNGLYGVKFDAYAGGYNGSYNMLYNNTFWHNGYGTESDQDYWDSEDVYHESGGYWNNKWTHGVYFDNDDETVQGNVVKNNLFYDNRNLSSSAEPIISYTGTFNYQTVTNNSKTADPSFVDIAGAADPTNSTQWDFNLQSSSTAIDGGTYLTQAVGAGTDSTTLVVDPNTSLYFFYDAGAIATAWPTANVNNDQICIGTVANCVGISSIDYATDTITLASAMTWADNANVWLYKKSDGTQVLYSSAPDYGAFEYTLGGSTWDITVSHGSNNTISPDDTKTVNDGDATAFVLTVDAGYRPYVGGTCGGTLTNLTYTTSAITADCTVISGATAQPTIKQTGGATVKSTGGATVFAQ